MKKTYIFGHLQFSDWKIACKQIYNQSKDMSLITRRMIPHPFDLSKIWRNVINLVKDYFIRHSIFQPLYFKYFIMSGKYILVSYVDFSYTMPPTNVNSLQATNIVWQKYLICTYRIFLASHYIQEHSQWSSNLLENKNIRYFGRSYNEWTDKFWYLLNFITITTISILQI